MLGTYIRNYRDKHAVTLRTKVISIALLWGTILFCISFVVSLLWLKILLGVILVGVTWHLASFRVISKNENMTLRRCRNPKDLSRLNVLIRNASDESGKNMPNRYDLSPGSFGRNEPNEYFLLRVAGVSAGYITVSRTVETLRIYEMYLLPAYRGRGFGRDAIIFLDYYCSFRRLPSLSLFIGHSDEGAAAFYLKFGFRTINATTEMPHRAGYVYLERLVSNIDAA